MTARPDPTGPRELRLDPDRAFPAEPGVRSIAREIHAATADLPIVAMHGHVEASLLRRDEPFDDPARLLVTPDHYLVRMLVSQAGGARAVPGVTGPHDLGVRSSDPAVSHETDPREIWRRFCAGWPLFRGTPTRFWLEHTLVSVLDSPLRPSAETADEIYDHLVERLAKPEMRPRALFERFGIEILSTTDPAHASLSEHKALAAEGWGERVVPTFRPDPLLHVDRPGWVEQVRLLGEAAGSPVDTYPQYLDALRTQRAAFVAAGARATDHGHLRADTTPLDDVTAGRIFDAALRRSATRAEAEAFSAHMLFQMAAMSCEDGLVMQLHPGVLRDHDRQVHDRLGPDVGYDIPTPTEYVHGLRPLLEAFGHHPRFRVVLFTVDETVFSRELAPLAGVYPAVRLGAPWWFLDSPDAMRRYREAVTETAGFYNTSGFVDDTRAYCSIPARHDLARRIDAGYLARLVAEGRLEQDEATETAVDLAYRLPRETYPAL
ncbi:uronate isomerase [Paraoerskovia sediminicola]|uniref:Uronate isomerase n=1 Tax=Paraoerskovia sediminicola TaxID=1138587 RepID=A0ABM8G010_9CELL|nr:glucuronate isomerase [Paraoerskovia sediminicola]BDZ41417.1 uronate isomerase [Paraoerskovia sediminicola]